MLETFKFTVFVVPATFSALTYSIELTLSVVRFEIPDTARLLILATLDVFIDAKFAVPETAKLETFIVVAFVVPENKLVTLASEVTFILLVMTLDVCNAFDANIFPVTCRFAFGTALDPIDTGFIKNILVGAFTGPCEVH